MKNTIQKLALSTNLVVLIFVLCGAQLHAQSHSALIDVTSLEQLNAIRYDLDGNGTPTSAGAAEYNSAFGTVTCPSCKGYELRSNLNFAGSRWAEGASGGDAVAGGWEPIGDNSSKFTATFDGNGHTISNLYINRPSTNYEGLFGYVSGANAKLFSIGLLSVKVTGKNWVGGLVGRIDDGMVLDSYATGAVSGDWRVGGLVGQNKGDISGSHATIAVTATGSGSQYTGGLVGRNDSSVSGSYATGAVTTTGANSLYTGGLVGRNDSSVSGSYATGAVTGTGQRVGSLVGENRGDVSSSYATGSVTGNAFVGGLVGTNGKGDDDAIGTVSDSYATGAVTATTGDSRVGGLVGINFAGSTISNSYATGVVMGNNFRGGLVGGNNGTITASYYNRQTTGQSDSGRGTPKTTAELVAPTGYAGIYGAWDDHADHWDFGTNLQYPVLKIDVDGNGTSGDSADLLEQRPLRLEADGDGLIEVSTLEQLNAIRYDLDGNGIVEDNTNKAAYDAAFGVGVLSGIIKGYELIVNLDFNDTNSYASGPINTAWTTGSGWNRIGNNNSRFTAIFEGNGHTISNLYINKPSTDYVGLFGYVSGSNAALRNIGLLEVEVMGKNWIGGLVGGSEGDISNSYATGAVMASALGDAPGIVYRNAGGLVGGNSGDISNSYATASVTGDNNVGGLVGFNDDGTVSGSYATGAVAGTGDNMGGLVGFNDDGTVSVSYATGAVAGTDLNSDYTGGLVGQNDGTISNSYATGAVTEKDAVGGLVGWNDGGTISNSYATGAVTGTARIGGLVGEIRGGTITTSYYNSQTTGQSDTGKGVAKTTADLLALTGYTGIYGAWNNRGDHWNFGTNEEYPVLKIDVDGDGTVGDADDLLAQRPPDALIEVSTLEQLNAIRYDLDGNGIVEDDTNQAAYSAAFGDPLPVGTIRGYQLINDLDFELASSYASGTINTTWTTGSGWEPIGDNSTSSNDSRFTAIFEGNGHRISNLYINSSTNYVGLFGYVRGNNAALRNIGMVDVEVEGNNHVGGLVGKNEGDISGSYATGSVTGDDNVGGLVGNCKSSTVSAIVMRRVQ